MPTSFILTLVAAFLAGVFLSGIALWLACRICRVRRPVADASPVRPSLYRAVAVVLVAGLLSFPLALATMRLDLQNRVLFALLQPLLGLVLIRLVLVPSLGRTVVVTVVWQVLALPLGLGMVLALYTFVCEGFFMPSGNLAETLLGYHKQVTCPSCGMAFAVNASREAEPAPPAHLALPARVRDCTCPNCRQPLRLDAGDIDLRDNLPEGWRRVADPGLTGGDRILAGKGLFGAARHPPARWDFVVFDHFEPQNPDTPVKYVKRLIGLPGETIAVHRGKLYHLPADRSAADEEDARRRFQAGEFRLLRKPPATVQAMRRLVYDHDHPAEDLTGAKWRRWVSEEGWEEDAGTFRVEAGAKTSWLRYRHVLRGNPRPRLITDFLGYNTGGNGHAPPGEDWASDLIIECEVHADQPAGELTLELSRGPDRFAAVFDLAGGMCKLVRRNASGETEMGDAPAGLGKAGPQRLRFANVDARLTVWVNGRHIFGDGVEYDPPKVLLPTRENDLERPASLGAKGASLSVRKLRLSRDNYFSASRGGHPANADDPDFDPADPARWGKAEESALAVFLVPEGHYFLLGDNSRESSDSRSWGPVPQRHLLGKVFFVYYPWGRVRVPR